VQAAVRRNRLEARTQPKVKRIAEHDSRFDFLEFARGDRLDGAVGAHGHEDRRLDHAVIQGQAPPPGLPVGGEQLEREPAGRRLAGRMFVGETFGHA